MMNIDCCQYDEWQNEAVAGLRGGVPEQAFPKGKGHRTGVKNPFLGLYWNFREYGLCYWHFDSLAELGSDRSRNDHHRPRFESEARRLHPCQP